MYTINSRCNLREKSTYSSNKRDKILKNKLSKLYANLYNENLKTLLKDTEVFLNKLKDIFSSWIGRVNIIKTILSKLF